MTGLHTGHAYIRGNGALPEGDTPLRPQDVTVAEVLREAGYRTALIGKWGLGHRGRPGSPIDRASGSAFGFSDQRHAHRQFTDHLWRNGERVAVDLEKDYANDLFTKEAGDFIERSDPRPFFVYVNYTVPHAELRVPEDSIEPFRGRFPGTAVREPRGRCAAERRESGRCLPGLPLAARAACGVRRDDYPHGPRHRPAGGWLGARGVDRQTLVIFTSDNGPHREGGGDPAFFKSSVRCAASSGISMRGGIRVPNIARWTGTIPAGRVSDHPWAHWDLLPTLADLAHAPIPAGLDGMSMSRALRGERQPSHPFLYWEFHERGFQQAVRMGRWKAVRLKMGAALELYDLEADPGEQREIAAAHPDVVRKIESYLKTARTESARWPAK